MTRKQALPDRQQHARHVRRARADMPNYHRIKDRYGTLRDLRDSDGVEPDEAIFDYDAQEWVPIWTKEVAS